MASFCASCGKPVPADAHFCPHCGARTHAEPVTDDTSYVGLYEKAPDSKPPRHPGTVDPAFAREEVGSPAAKTPAHPGRVDPAFAREEIASPAARTEPLSPDERWRPPWLWITGSLAVLLALAALMGFFRGDKTLTPLTDAELNSTSPTSADTVFYAASMANVRAKPSTGSQLVDTLARGEEVRGTLVEGQGGPASWLKLEEDRYVSRANLLSAPPPALASEEAVDLAVSSRCNVVKYPSPGAPVATTLAAGTRVRVNGVTANGYAEIGLPKGGIGYADEGGQSCFGSDTVFGAAGQMNEAGMETAAPTAPAAPITASGGCDFGAGIVPAFAAMETTAPGAGGLKFASVGKRFYGITAVSAFVTGGGQRGILFNAPMGTVRAAFDRAGYEPPEGMELTVAHPNYRRFGQTMLTCRG